MVGATPLAAPANPRAYMLPEVPEEPRFPEFARGSELLQTAYRYAYDAHHGPARQEGGTDIEHPVAVAALLSAAGFEDDVVAAALLHDVVEDTALQNEDILESFGRRIPALVEVMTEYEAIPDYEHRKAEHRKRVLAAGYEPAAIYLADKLARVRRYTELGEPVEARRLQHYRQTVDLFEADGDRLPFISELRNELPRLASSS